MKAINDAFNTKSLATAGYQKLPSGLIIQWGVTVVAANSSATIALPLIFPANFFAVIGNSATGGMTAGHNAAFAASPNGLNQVALQNLYDASVIGIAWIAIGN
jgi:hypothetical protein